MKIGDMAGATPLVLTMNLTAGSKGDINVGATYEEIEAAVNTRPIIIDGGNLICIVTSVMPSGSVLNLRCGSLSDKKIIDIIIKEGTTAGTCNVNVDQGNIDKSYIGLGNVTNDAQVKRTEMGKANGVATLGADGKVPAEQLPQLDTSLYLPVAELPVEDIKTDKIYLVPATETAEDNIYDEYLYVEGKWEKFGSVQAKADLSGYYTKTEADGKFATKTVASSSADGLMSKTDKAKLDALPAGSEVVTSVVLEVETI